MLRDKGRSARFREPLDLILSIFGFVVFHSFIKPLHRCMVIRESEDD
jgi:hypothetical protein